MKRRSSSARDGRLPPLTSVLKILVRRIATHWRLELCLLAGLLLAVGVAAAVPLYTSGSLQRSFREEWMQLDVLPGLIQYEVAASSTDLTATGFLESYRYLETRLPNALGRKNQLSFSCLTYLDEPMFLYLWGGRTESAQFTVTAMSALPDLVTPAKGRLPRAEVGADGVVEIACLVTDAETYGMHIGDVYEMDSPIIYTEYLEIDEEEPTVHLSFRLVGLLKLRDDRLNSPGWAGIVDPNNTLFAHPEAFLEYLVKKREARPAFSVLNLVLDHERIKCWQLPHLLRFMHELERDVIVHAPLAFNFVSPAGFFTEFTKRLQSLQLIVFALALPTLILLLYYIILMAGLLVNQRRGEIAMLRSRGATTLQLVGAFALEWSALGLCCVALGPPLGLFLAQVVGASSGFLNFVDRGFLPAALTLPAYFYAGIMALVAIIAATIPAAKACRHNIVSYKHEQSRKAGRPFWHRFYLDFLLLGLCAYGYRLMFIQTKAAAGTSSLTEIGRMVDPMLFLIPTGAALALGLIVLRCLPLLAGLAGRFFSRGRYLELHTSLVEVARNADRYRPLILLLIMTVTTGIYGAAIARTLDRNLHDQVYQKFGTDLVVTDNWYHYIIDPTSGFPPAFIPDLEHPFEPAFTPHREAPGVTAAAKVQTTRNVSIANNQAEAGNAAIMAIEPHEFGRVAWFRSDMASSHVNEYLNLLTRYPYGAVVSRGLITNGTFSLGDTISADLNNKKVDFTIIAAVNYWPTLDPDAEQFCIVNLKYVTDKAGKAPYDVWHKLDPDAEADKIAAYLMNQGLRLMDIKDARYQLVRNRHDPWIMGLFGVISIGFCVSVLLTAAGYFLYTFITIRGRFLQFGVLRAIGLTLKQLVGILGLEQLWAVGLGVGLGGAAGIIIAKLFVPFMRISAGMTSPTPPFMIVFQSADVAVIFLVLLPILGCGLLGLGYVLARMQIHQAVKMGEEG